jgi:hypothetical protein
MARTTYNAQRGLSTATEALDRLGLSVDDLMAMQPEEQFATYADALAKIENPTMKAALAQELFGRSGSKLLPMLENGAAGLEDYKNRAKELGLAVPTRAVEAMNDRFDDARKAIGGLANRVLPKIAPHLATVAGHITDAIKGIDVEAVARKITTGIENLIWGFEHAKAALKSFAAGWHGLQAVVNKVTGVMLDALAKVDRAVQELQGGTKEDKDYNRRVENRRQLFDQERRVRREVEAQRVRLETARDQFQRASRFGLGPQELNKYADAYTQELAVLRELERAHAKLAQAVSNSKEVTREQTKLEQMAATAHNAAGTAVERAAQELQNGANIAANADKVLAKYRREVAQTTDRTNDLADASTSAANGITNVGDSSDTAAPQVKTLAQKMADVHTSMKRTLASGVGSMFADIALDARDANEAIRDLARNIARMAIQRTVEVGISHAMGVPSYASGGYAPRPTFAVVGDSPGGEHMVPHHKVPEFVAEHGGGPTVHMTINTPNADSFRASQSQIMREAQRQTRIWGR